MRPSWGGAFGIVGVAVGGLGARRTRRGRPRPDAWGRRAGAIEATMEDGCGVVPRLSRPHQEASRSLPARCLGRSRCCAFVAACPEGGNLWLEEAESTLKMLCQGRPPKMMNLWASAPTALARSVLTWPNTCHFPLQGKEDRRAESDRGTIWSSQSTRPGALLSSGRIQALEAIRPTSFSRSQPPGEGSSSLPAHSWAQSNGGGIKSIQGWSVGGVRAHPVFNEKNPHPRSRRIRKGHVRAGSGVVPMPPRSYRVTFLNGDPARGDRRDGGQ